MTLQKLLDRLSRLAGKHRMVRLINFWPPYLGAGIRIDRVTEDLRRVEVSMRLTPLNSNYVGTHFGGSLYAMCDPFFMFIAIENLGRDYIVWDKAASIRFVKPGRGKVRAVFELSEEQLAAMREAADRDGRTDVTLPAEVRDEQGDVVARLEKVIYVRRKDARRPEATSRSAAG